MDRLVSGTERRRRLSGSKLQELREAKRATQHDLASALRRRGFGTTQANVSRWENGQQPHASVLPALAELLGVEIGDLFAADGDEDEEDDLHAALASVIERLVDRRVDRRLAGATS